MGLPGKTCQARSTQGLGLPVCVRSETAYVERGLSSIMQAAQRRAMLREPCDGFLMCLVPCTDEYGGHPTRLDRRSDYVRSS